MEVKPILWIVIPCYNEQDVLPVTSEMFLDKLNTLSENEKYLILSGAAFSFGVATKWTAVYAAAGVAVILFVWMICKLRTLRSEKAYDRSLGMRHMKKQDEKERTEYKSIVRFVIICISVYILLPSVQKFSYL